MHKRVFLLIIVAFILLSTLPGLAVSLTKAELYTAALSELKAYLNDNDSMSPEEICDAFSSLGSYEYSAEFALYARVLTDAANGLYDSASQLISYLRINNAFCIYTQEDEELGTIDELAWYIRGLQAESTMDYAVAVECYQNCISFKDSFQRTIGLLDKAPNTVSPPIPSSTSADNRQTPYKPVVAAGWDFVMALCQDGSVKAAGDNKDNQSNVHHWADIIQIDAFNTHSLGLCSNGTVVSAGSNYHGESNVSSWSNIVQVSAGYHHTLGLTAQGTVLATGNNAHGQCNVAAWRDIKQAEGGLEHSVGLKSDGTVIAAGSNSEGQLNVSNWANIIQIDAGKFHTVGLTENGTLVATGKLLVTGDYPYDMTPMLHWDHIVQVSASDYHTVGLRTDGTVEAAGWNKYGQCNVDTWSNIVAVAAGTNNTIGLKADGTIVIAGSNNKNQYIAADWRSMGPHLAIQ